MPGLPDVERCAAELFRGRFDECGFPDGAEIQVNSEAAFERARGDGQLWVAEAPDGATVGFALMMVLGGYAHLDELGVHPDHGRRGLGAALLAGICDWADRSGYPGVTLSTFRSIPWNAPFYERHGFAAVEPANLSPAHARLVQREAARGLRTDLRVVMLRPATAAADPG